MEACCCNLEVDVNGEETFMVDKVTLSLSLFDNLVICFETLLDDGSLFSFLLCFTFIVNSQSFLFPLFSCVCL